MRAIKGFIAPKGFGFGNPSAFGFAINVRFNVCVTELGTDGTFYGADGILFGALSPNSTITDQTFYTLKWDNTGHFVVQFGDAGNEQIFDVPQVIFYHESQLAPVIAKWNSVDLRYEAIGEHLDLQLATTLIALQVGGATRACFDFEIEPVEFISYDYNLETI